MKPLDRIAAPMGAVAAALCLLASTPAQAGLIKMNYSGTVFGYFGLDIVQDDFPPGTPVSMSLTYDDSFIGQPAGQFYLGLAPAISGTMDLGAGVGVRAYALQAMRLSYFGYGATLSDPSPIYGFHVTGSGPATDDGEVFSGIDLFFVGASLGAPTLVGFGNTNWQVADNGYLRLSGTASHERLANPVPSPGTLALFLAGLGAWGGGRLRFGARAARSSAL